MIEQKNNAIIISRLKTGLPPSAGPIPLNQDALYVEMHSDPPPPALPSDESSASPLKGRNIQKIRQNVAEWLNKVNTAHQS